MDPTRTKLRALHLKFTFVLEAEWLESAIFCCYFFAVYLIRCSFPRGLKVTYCTLLQQVKIFHSGTSSPISPGKMIRQFLISSPILGHDLLDFFQGELWKGNAVWFQQTEPNVVILKCELFKGQCKLINWAFFRKRNWQTASSLGGGAYIRSLDLNKVCQL